MQAEEQLYYVENRGSKKLYRAIRSGTKEMLNCENKEAIVQIRNLDVIYGHGAKAFHALKDLNLNIYQGEVLGLVGESGSGKTTAGRAIIGLTPHSFGQIKILDRIIPKDRSKVNKWSKKGKDIINFMVNKVQMIFQDPTNSLNPFKDVETVVGEGLTNLKTSRYLYLTNIDIATYIELNKKLGSIDEKVMLTQDPWADVRLRWDDVADLYKFVHVETVQKVQNMATLHPDKDFSSVLSYLKEQKEFRDTENNLKEKECKRKLIIDILHQVGLDETVLRRFPLEFSGGQQQRVGICRAVVLQPQILIADEPISALDVSIQAQVINIFKELKEKYNLTIIFIAHDLRMVEYISDRIAVINKGTLLEVGPTKEVIHNPHHPYTQSLLDAVPSIEAEKGSLVGQAYNSSSHEYDEHTQPKWQQISQKHFVLATDEEFVEFVNKAKTYKSKFI
ncbi:oligopeptide ABC transporter ATP-binding protein (OppF) [Mycoplasmopsis californica HAZ160_1]|uniref:Oligopeptide ABC transporter ATP-binding protein (OppF) n=1 Tax=Mycoplasmopsis californica HAZ160_1 TaxID=1397850 RepID=A0AAT9F8J9_9BACT|nr:ABC transporter ATP-binding protein [Mycoplasmopsis californica]BAP01226.1 oligopeptide ABC transporter ATP-binding protein (OppF) [Mycoplasmopsis californica HAZ160_1]BBG41100.1 oligopeptide ABC transporter ATP-binding protein [Mycoplasmopsis californica]BBG41693.1 oligopeptide ABC transporter ATP-binding protein [Mycoplasmopsis californica]BBG42287.1 oligopeptide ABC transporter ATP-binding protein [Mycoplasmopsis californica]BBG42862.1 oligopeptide ABC transporter ATP-binding protein [My